MWSYAALLTLSVLTPARCRFPWRTTCGFDPIRRRGYYAAATGFHCDAFVSFLEIQTPFHHHALKRLYRNLHLFHSY
jgi:hypothetical protein